MMTADLALRRANDKGPDSKDFYVNGLTMRVENPEFDSVQTEYKAILDDLGRIERENDQARTWREQVQADPRSMLFVDAERRKMLEDVRIVLNEATWIRKPFEIGAERTERFRSWFRAAIANDANFVAVDELLLTGELDKIPLNAPPDELRLEESKARIRQLIANVRRLYTESIERTTFADVPIVRVELFDELNVSDGYFSKYLALELVKLRNTNQLPFDVTEEEELEWKFYEEVVRANAVSVMRDEWFDKWRAAHAADVSDVEARRLLERVTTFIGDREDVALRDREMPTKDTISKDLIGSVASSIRLEAELGNIGRVPTAARAEQLDRIRAQRPYVVALGPGPTEEQLQVQRARAFLEADALYTSTRYALVRLRQQMTKIDRFITVPLETIRNANSPKSFSLNVQVVSDADKPLESNDIRYTYRYFYQQDGDPTSERLVWSVTKNKLNVANLDDRAVYDTASDTFVVASPRSPGDAAYSQGAHAGVYRVEVVREIDGQAPTVLHSERATLHVVADCARCEIAFEVGTTRTFGECRWSANPINDALARYQARDEFEPYTLALHGTGAGNTFDYQPYYDDSILNASGTLIISDESLLALTTMSDGELRRRYFTYEAVLRNINQRLPSTLRALYGVRGAQSALNLFSKRVAKSSHPLLGAMYAVLHPPMQVLLLDAQQELKPIFDDVSEAADLLSEPADSAAHQAARQRTYEDLLNEAQKAQQFEIDILMPLDMAEMSSLYGAMDALGVSTSLLSTPLVGVFAAFEHAIVRSFATQSELRFLDEVRAKFTQFSESFLTQNVGAALPMYSMSSNKRQRADDGRRIRRRLMQSMQEQLEQLTASDVRSTADRRDMFVDSRGERRLFQRIQSISKRSGAETRTRARLDELHADTNQSLHNELQVSRAFNRPLGISRATWAKLDEMAYSTNISGSARLARAINKESSQRADWGGIHDESDNQPTPYDVIFEENLATIARGSERLYSGYDFRNFHRRLEQLVREYNAEPTAKRRTYITTLAIHFNALAQFAPPLGNRSCPISMQMIEREIQAATQ